MIRGDRRSLLLPFAPWIEIADGDDAARELFDRHYSRYHYADGRKPKLFVGPGFKMVLTTPCRRALFVWRLFKSADDQEGVNCAVFRNEGAGLSSELIRAADGLADERWPGMRHYTYVSPHAVANSNPGRCFVRAGWSYVRDGKGKHAPRALTKRRGLLILERISHSPPAPPRARPPEPGEAPGPPSRA